MFTPGVDIERVLKPVPGVKAGVYIPDISGVKGVDGTTGVDGMLAMLICEGDLGACEMLESRNGSFPPPLGVFSFFFEFRGVFTPPVV